MLLSPWMADFALASSGLEGFRNCPAIPRRLSSREMTTESLAFWRSESKSGNRRSAARATAGRQTTMYAAQAIHPPSQEGAHLIRRAPGWRRMYAPPGRHDQAIGW